MMPINVILDRPLEVDIKSLNQSPTAFYVVDERGQILYFNQAMERLFDLAPDQYLGQAISILAVDPDDTFRKITSSLDSGHGNWQGVIEARASDGRTFPCQISATRLSDEKNGLSITLGMVTDLSGQRQTLSDLKSRSDRLGALASLAARVGVYRDPSLLANEALNAIAELTPIIQGFILLIDEDTGKLKLHSSTGMDTESLEKFQVETGWEQCTEGKALSEKVPILIRETGMEEGVCCPMKTHAKSVAVIPLIIRDQLIGVLSVATAPPDTLTETDMEFLVALASQIGIYLENARLNRNLEAQNRLLQSQNTDLQELLSIISHDLRSPLATIAGYASLLMKDGEKIEEKERQVFSKTIFRKTQETSRRFDDLLDFFRITLDSEELKPEPVNIRQVVEQALEEAGSEDMVGQVDIRVDEDMPVLLGYQAHIMHIFVNLLSNAVKFTMGQDSPAIKVEYSRTSDPEKAQHCFTVSDNGPGIPSDYHQSIFKPFHRVPAAEEIPGSGVGLAAVQRIVRLHGGSVSVDSQPGQGSSFTFCLPWREVKQRPSGE